MSLDGTFNSGRTYLGLMDRIGTMPGVTFHFQTRPEPLATPEGEEFMKKCVAYGNAYLEIGVQTIVPEEMATIGRKNDVGSIAAALRRLTELKIPYETNLIFGIPGQTLASFHKSIDFLIANGCDSRNIKTYALRIPQDKSHQAGWR